MKSLGEFLCREQLLRNYLNEVKVDNDTFRHDENISEPINIGPKHGFNLIWQISNMVPLLHYTNL